MPELSEAVQQRQKGTPDFEELAILQWKPSSNTDGLWAEEGHHAFMARPRANTKVEMFHGEQLVSESVNEAWPDGAKELGWHFVIQTKREYKRGEQCWLANSLGTRISVRPEKIQSATGTYLVQFGTTIPDEWEAADKPA